MTEIQPSKPLTPWGLHVEYFDDKGVQLFGGLVQRPHLRPGQKGRLSIDLPPECAHFRVYRSQ